MPSVCRACVMQGQKLDSVLKSKLQLEDQLMESQQRVKEMEARTQEGEPC